MKPHNLIAKVALLEDMEQNAEGLDKQVLAQAVEVTEFSEGQDAANFLMELMNEGLIV